MEYDYIKGPIPYFQIHELACRHCGLVNLHPGFGAKLVELREAYNRSMVFTSCCRCQIHNAKVGGVEGSMHLTENIKWQTNTIAADVEMLNSQNRSYFLAHAISLGWTVGIAKTFIHIDQRMAFTKLPIRAYVY